MVRENKLRVSILVGLYCDLFYLFMPDYIFIIDRSRPEEDAAKRHRKFVSLKVYVLMRMQKKGLIKSYGKGNRITPLITSCY